MVSINLSSISTLESLGSLKNSTTIRQVRISAPEFSFSNSFSSAFAIGQSFRPEKIIRSILNGSILSLEAFGEFTFPKVVLLSGVVSREYFGTLFFNGLYVYSLNEILYIVDEAKHNRLEKVSIKNIIVQKIDSGVPALGSGSPYKIWGKSYYSVMYEDTLGRYWEEQELTRTPELFFDWYLGAKAGARAKAAPNRGVVSINSLGKRKKAVDWTKSKLFSKKMAEKGILQRIKIKKARIRKGNMLVYLDEKNNSWEESELVFETMATMLINKYKEEKGANR